MIQDTKTLALLLNLVAGTILLLSSTAQALVVLKIQSSPRPLRYYDPCSSALCLSSDGTTNPTDDQEETLLCVNLRVKEGVELDEAMSSVSNFCQTFPFAAVLPVQPLHYLPLEESGVEVKFLRKKTDIKSGVDGGIRFFVTSPTMRIQQNETDTSPNNEQEEEENQEDVPDDEDSDGDIIEIKAKRNSVGQVISKLMSEKLIVTKFVAELQKQQLTASAPNDAVLPLPEAVLLTSIYHKWMS